MWEICEDMIIVIVGVVIGAIATGIDVMRWLKKQGYSVDKAGNLIKEKTNG